MARRMQKPAGFDSLIYGQDPQCTITMDWTKTQCNSNSIVEGPSGSGKTWNFVVPCLARMENTNPVAIVTKKSTMKMTAEMLKKHGYHISFLNFVDPKKSDYGYDPIHYCKRETDVTDVAYTMTHSDPIRDNLVWYRYHPYTGAKRITQEKMAEFMRISKGTYGKLETGARGSTWTTC